MNQAVNIRININHGWILLQELEAIGVLSIEKPIKATIKAFNGKQYRGIVPTQEVEKFKQHFENIRDEWERDIIK